MTLVVSGWPGFAIEERSCSAFFNKFSAFWNRNAAIKSAARSDFVNRITSMLSSCRCSKVDRTSPKTFSASSRYDSQCATAAKTLLQ
jgi:hypothetical protein